MMMTTAKVKNASPNTGSRCRSGRNGGWLRPGSAWALLAAFFVFALVPGISKGACPIDVSIAADTDDAEEYSEDGAIDLYSSDLEFTEDLGSGTANQIIGLRFTGLTIAQGANITSAYLEFTADETQSDATNLTFKAQDIDSAPTFTAATSNITSRNTTTASVAWNIVPSWNSVGGKHQSPDLAAIIQEVVDRTGWASGNDLAVIVTGTLGSHRTAESFDGGGTTVLLHVECGAAPTPAVTSAVAEISPNDVVTSSTGNAFSYDIQATIGGSDTGVDRIAITVPGGFGAPTVTAVQVDGIGVAYIDNTSGNAISVDLTTKVTASSKITVLFNANAPGTQDITGVNFTSTVDDSATGDAAQSTTEGDGDGDAGDANSWTVTTTDAPAGLSTNYRSIGTNAATLYATGDASITSGTTTVTFAAGASLPVATVEGAVGQGDKLVMGGETFFILSRDSATQVTVQTAAASTHSSAAYTISRAYNTLQAWEDNCAAVPGCLPTSGGGRGGDLVADDRYEIGVAYNDAGSGAFIDNDTNGSVVYIRGSTVDVTRHRELTVAVGQRHNGTAGTGAVVDGQTTTAFPIRVGESDTRVEWLEIKNGYDTADGVSSSLHVGDGPNTVTNVMLEYMLVYDYDNAGQNNAGARSLTGGGINSFTIRNSIFYNGNFAVRSQQSIDTVTVENCTSYDMSRTAFEIANSGVMSVTNTIATSSNNDFSAGITGNYNLDEDGSAPGANSLHGMTAANQFVSIAAGSEDLHLKAGANAINAGTDLSGSFTGDIDGDTRPIAGAWEIGADETSAAGPTAVSSALAEISPNDVTTSSTANAFSYDIQATISGGNTGVNRVAITAPVEFTVQALPVSVVLVDDVSVGFTDNSSGNAISVDLTTKVTASSKITLLFSADAPASQDLTGVDFTSTVDDSGTGDAAQATTEGNGDGDAGDNNSWTVTTTSLNNCPGGISTTTDSTTAGSLRACIIWANGNPGTDTLTVPAGTYTFTLAGSDDVAAVGDLDITDDIIINGNATSATIIDANSINRVFDILGVSATFTNLTIRGGSIGTSGGGIDVNSTGSLTMSNSTVSGNTAGSGDGGGIATGGGTVSLTNVTVSGNSANDGGGLHCDGGDCTLTNVTVSGNTATGLGGGLNCAGSCTATFLNTIVANNGGPECSGSAAALVSDGYNLSSDASCDFTSGGDQQNTDPLLGPLQDNGGPTFTHDLLVGSTAIEGGTNTGCPATDQRGTARPDGTTCDIGAVEGVAPSVPNVCSVWSLQTSGTTEALRGLHFPVGDAIGYAVGNAVGNAGTILKTTNGGTNWNPLPSAAQQLNGVYFPVDATTGWVIGNLGLILKTVDGGASWVAQTSNTIENLNGIHFPVDALTGYVVGSAGVIRKTTDGGANWNILPSATENLSAVQFPAGATTGYAVGGNGLIIKTTNGGAGWVAQTSGTTESLNGVNFPVGTVTGWVLGNTGVIRKTTDGGANWNPQVSGTTDNLDDIQFPTNNSTGYLIGEFGRVMDTTSGGAIWTLDASVPTANDLRAIQFPLNENTGYITGNNGTILKCGVGGVGGPTLEIVKRSFETDGTPIPSGSIVPDYLEFKYLLYINNKSGVRADVSVRDVLVAAFQYQTGTIQVDNSVAGCALVVCTAAEELAIFTAVDGAAVLTDAVDLDAASYTGAGLVIDAGDENVGNPQLDINADSVWAILFSVKMP